MIDPKPSRVLQAILAHLLEHAHQTPGSAVCTRLTNNLRVTVMVKNNLTYLQISRSGVYPSQAEWRMIMRNWPYPVAWVEPTQETAFGRRALYAILRPASLS